MKRTGLKRGKPLKNVSDKRRTENKSREVTRRIVAKRSGGVCEGRVLIARVDPVAASNCKRKAVDMHEKLKRSRGGSITDASNILHLCRSCHDWTESEVALATEVGLLVSQYGDAESEFVCEECRAPWTSPTYSLGQCARCGNRTYLRR